MAEAVASYVLGSDALKDEEKKLLREKAIEALMTAIQAKGKNPADYIIRDVLPKDDLGMSDNKWEETLDTAGAWNTVINHTLGDDEFIVIFGVGNNNDNPVATAMKIFRGATPIYLVELEKLYVKQEPEGYFTNPLVFRESDKLVVQLYLPSGVTTPANEKVFLLALKAEPKGEVVTGA